MYETPADIMNMISTWESDNLNSTCPAIQEKLRTALMVGTERVDDFFWRVRGSCKELQKAGAPVDQNYAWGLSLMGLDCLASTPCASGLALCALKTRP